MRAVPSYMPFAVIMLVQTEPDHLTGCLELTDEFSSRFRIGPTPRGTTGLVVDEIESWRPQGCVVDEIVQIHLSRVSYALSGTRWTNSRSCT